jgi:hypothetical protein
MAYSKSPQFQTYKTQPVLLMNEMNSRDQTTNKDVENLNCFFDLIRNKQIEDQEYNVVKRAGTSTFGDALQSTAHRGLYYWEEEDLIYVAVDNDIQVFAASNGSLNETLSNVFTTSSGDVGFTEFLYEDNTVKIVATDGTRLVTIDAAGTVVTGADADMPAHLPQPIFLDGYLFIVKADTADIYNSDLNSPLVFTAGNFLVGEMFPDKIFRICKLNNYLVAFGSSSIEYFWDAAVATGSPLQRNDTPVKLVGFLGGFAQQGNSTFFVGNTTAGTPDVYRLEDFKIEPIGSASIRRYLEVLNVGFEDIYGSCISFFGHDFYVINVESAPTFIYDLETKIWTRIAYQDSITFGITNAVNVKIATEYCSVFLLTGSARIRRFDQDIYQDAEEDFTVRVVTDRQMFETYNQKFQHRLVINADRPSADSSMSVYWSDDDYQTWSTVKSINLNQELPSVMRGGRFRRRAYKLEYADNYPLRMKNLDIDLNMGQH